MKADSNFSVTKACRATAFALLAGALATPAIAAGSGAAYVQQAAPPADGAFVDQLSPTAAPRVPRRAPSAKKPASKSAARSAAETQKTAVLELRITDLGAVVDGMPLTLPTVRDGVSYKLDTGAAR